MKVEPTGTYQAKDDEGATHTITIHTTFTEFVPPSGRPEWHPGSQQHRMKNGNHVNVYDDGWLEEVETGRRMKTL